LGLEWVGSVWHVLSPMLSAQAGVRRVGPEPPVELFRHCSVEVLSVAMTGVLIAPETIRWMVREAYVGPGGPVRSAVRGDREAPGGRPLRGALLGTQEPRRSQWSTSGLAPREVVEDVAVNMEERPGQVDGLAQDAAAPELRPQLELVLACQVRRVFFRQSQEEEDVCGDVGEMDLAQWQVREPKA